MTGEGKTTFAESSGLNIHPRWVLQDGTAGPHAVGVCGSQYLRRKAAKLKDFRIAKEV